MGSRLAIVAALSVAVPATARADKKQLARDLFDLGIEEYRAKQFDAAIASLSKSYALDPQPNALYALAQSERLNNDCKDAIVHYQQLIDSSKEPKIVAAVKDNLELCKQAESGHDVAPAAPVDVQTVEKRDAPVVEIKTVYRTEHKTDKLTIGLYAGSGIALGSSIAMFLVAHSTRNDADRATTLPEFNQLFDRAKYETWGAYAATGAAVAMASIATYRVFHRGDEASAGVAIVPIAGGSLVAWARSW